MDDFAVISTTREPVLTASPKRILKRAEALGWTVQTCGAVTHHEAVLMVADGKELRRGDVKTPEHDRTHVWMRARHPGGPLGFLATWTDGKFVDALVLDPYGIPVENRANYLLSAAAAKENPTLAALRAEADALYNDGSTRLEKRHLFSTATDFTNWLDEWTRVLGPTLKNGDANE